VSRARALLLLGVAALCCLMAQPALALPAPMSKSELLLKSDLVALVRILAVTCTGATKDAQTGEDLPSYSANAELIEIIKGEEMKGDDIAITFHAIPESVAGPWTVYYYPGEMVWTHLVRQDGSYTTTWWNGRGTVVEKPAVTELPTTPGETVSLRRTRLEHPAEPLTPKP
jgi:hypothetical protein